MYIGIDPGWKNLGWSLIDNQKVLTHGTIDASQSELGSVTMMIEDEISDYGSIKAISMERFVYYNGVHNPDSENILMVTGQFQSWAFREGMRIQMYRAIDWKTSLAQHIKINLGETNPFRRLDKDFSLWAAEVLTGIHFSKDHEADATCLAWLAREQWQRSQR